ncbi:sensor domain-containing diguanylate cyclase [Microbulbifer hainanensis]|uniref:sensor domain-containing diguanylate cyclase n=1 Tax=Microbulbifer hainanensis TaxID=2735675 RepID=UPI001867FF76|nr:diguanylate cyclase [Microbulbifer hainanensis]
MTDSFARVFRTTSPRASAGSLHKLWWRLFAALLFVICAEAPRADSTAEGVLVLSSEHEAPLGERASFLIDSTARLTLAQARNKLVEGEYSPARSAVPAFGIGSAPVWFHLKVRNPGTEPRSLQLVIGKTWLDYVDVYQLQNGDLRHRWQTGDGMSANPRPVPGIGFVLPVNFAPGDSELFLRAQTDEPLVLSVSLLSDTRLGAMERWAHYHDGLLYGFLLAFILYNAMLYFGLRDRSHLYYSLYLFSYIVLNLTYNGHLGAWLWPDHPGIQRYAIMVCMVLFSCAGFLFARRFLHLDLHAPRAQQWVTWGSIAALVLMAIAVVTENQYFAAQIAFNAVALFTIGMVGLGCLTVSHGERAGTYFLGAALCSMVGVAITLFSVWGFLPMNQWTFRGAEFGLVLEATLFSLALASRVRMQEQARRNAELLSRTDTLTGLTNRRAFCTDAAGIWSTALRYGRPLSVILLDIDHFKKINDRHGHHVGDCILVRVAQLLSENCREGDLVSRWGGEEFVLLLPETELARACVLAERIRHSIAQNHIGLGRKEIALSVSLGVAQRSGQFTLEDLICEADRWMYRAKNEGRNRVCAAIPLEAVI